MSDKVVYPTHHSRFLYWLGNLFSRLGYALDRPVSLKNAWCRFNNHPEGTVFYSHGYEPDDSCINCGEDLG